MKKNFKTLRDYANRPSEEYVVYFTDHKTSTLTCEVITLDMEIAEDGADFEWKYSIAEVADKMAELKVGQSLSFREERDDDKHMCLVIRTK